MTTVSSSSRAFTPHFSSPGPIASLGLFDIAKQVVDMAALVLESNILRRLGFPMDRGGIFAQAHLIRAYNDGIPVVPHGSRYVFTCLLEALCNLTYLLTRRRH